MKVKNVKFIDKQNEKIVLKFDQAEVDEDLLDRLIEADYRGRAIAQYYDLVGGDVDWDAIFSRGQG